MRGERERGREALRGEKQYEKRGSVRREREVKQSDSMKDSVGRERQHEGSGSVR